MNRGTLKIESSHTDEIRVSLTLSDDRTVWMTVEEIAGMSAEYNLKRALSIANP